LTGCGVTAGRLWTILPAVPISFPGLAGDTNVKQAVISCLQTYDIDFFYAGIQELGPRCDKCFNASDGYVKV
jgi:hypothetical protein